MQDSAKSILYFVRDEKILLLRKTDEQRWRGVSISGDPAEVRESSEMFRPDVPIGLMPMHTVKIAEQQYETIDSSEKTTIHAYICDEWTGELSVPEGYEVRWFSSEEMPYDDMLPDRGLWLPLALAGTPMQGSHIIEADGSTIEHSVTSVDELHDDAPTSQV